MIPGHAEAAADVLRKLRQTGESSRGRPCACACQRGPKVSVFANILDCVTDSVANSGSYRKPVAASRPRDWSRTPATACHMLARLGQRRSITEEQAIAEIRPATPSRRRSGNFPVGGACALSFDERARDPAGRPWRVGLRGFLRHPGSDFASGRDCGLDEFAPLRRLWPSTKRSHRQASNASVRDNVCARSAVCRGSRRRGCIRSKLLPSNLSIVSSLVEDDAHEGGVVVNEGT